jgi:protein AaeX
MRFVEIDLFGVYVAPISLMLVGAWLISLALRRMANHAGHPALFTFATYIIVLSSWILIVAR